VTRTGVTAQTGWHRTIQPQEARRRVIALPSLNSFRVRTKADCTITQVPVAMPLQKERRGTPCSIANRMSGCAEKRHVWLPVGRDSTTRSDSRPVMAGLRAK
jgi:hypothetical protein